MTETADNRRPGDLTKDELIDRIIRVDHAGEFGAKRIYEGQLAVLRGKPEAQAIENAPIVRCDVPAWTMFGISMAGYNILYALALAAFTLKGALRSKAA